MDERAVPECLRLEVRPGFAPSARPPVRIFLGTQASQFRPERVFVWSIEQVRDPSRVYEIHLMKELAGFDRRGWTTGFTNYRFAIPAFCRGAGRAIYNDEDQIYLTDPAELFDAEMAEHGWLAISERESSVMLLDCARMAPVWTLDDARRLSKKALLARARARPELFGRLAPEWNARDGEYERGRSHLLHYTTLHTQPWRPFPEQFVYQPHPLASLWHDLERSADRAGFTLFTRERPSRRFAALRRPARHRAVRAEADTDPELAELAAQGGARDLLELDPFADAPPGHADGVVCRAGLDAVPEDDVPWLLDEMFAAARRFVLCRVSAPPRTQRGPRATESVTDPARWPAHLAAASARRPQVHHRLVVTPAGGGSTRRHTGGPRLSGTPPDVCVLADLGEEDAGAAWALAAELDWPVTPGAFDAGPPWPELAIAAGRRGAAAARRLRERSGGRTRSVAVGRRAGARAEDFDLVVTPASAGFFAHPARHETALPLVRPDAARLRRAAESWRKLFDEAPAPRLALLIDDVAGARLGAGDARRIGEAARGASDGGSVFALVSERLPAAALAALETALAGGGRVQRGAPSPLDEATQAHLALADAFACTLGDESLLSHVCATGRPLLLVGETPRPRGALRATALRVALAGRANDRGTVRPQQGLERFLSRLVASGRLRPPHDLRRAIAALEASGAARRPGVSPGRGPAPLRDLERAAERVRLLLGA